MRDWSPEALLVSGWSHLTVQASVLISSCLTGASRAGRSWESDKGEAVLGEWKVTEEGEIGELRKRLIKC